MISFQTREGTYNNTKNFTAHETTRNLKGENNPLVASVAIEEGTFLTVDAGTGNYRVATAGDRDLVLLAQTIRSTDSDFAVAGKKKLTQRVSEINTPFNFTVGAGGTLSDASVGVVCALHTDGKSLNITPVVGGQFTIVDVVDSTHGVAKINASAI